MGNGIDSIYYRDGVDKSWSMNVLKVARQRMFELFLRTIKPTAESTVLDIGVSDDENDGANFLEKHYPWQRNIICAGLGDGAQVKARYPEVRYQKISANERLPFGDKSVDIACSNAVLEHVGGPIERANFIREHLRVAHSVFLTVPNRWFPVEHHTGIPLLHYSSTLFRRALAGGDKSYWVDPRNMDFIGRALLLREWPVSERPEIYMTGIPLGRFSSNIAVVVRR
jgi:SAM-dependent methyltransferase